MALPVRQQITYWGLALAALMLVLWGLGSVILPFLLGGAVAYFLDPIADRMERMGLSRAAATVLIAVVVVAIFVMLLLLVLPMLIRQAAQLVTIAPDVLGRLQGFLSSKFPGIMEQGGALHDAVNAVTEAVKSRGGELAQGILSSAMSVINAIVFMVVVPVVAFYMLLDWDRLVAHVDKLLPRDHAPVIRQLGRDIDKVLAAFVRGQMTVCLILGAFYAIALTLVGLDFGLVVGAISGAIAFIPYVGTIVGGVLAIGLALFQFWGDWVSIGLVAGIFALGQFLEGNFITPKLVGGSIGLHPVWLIFALSAFGTLFGFTGMLVAVPVAAAIGVLVRFGISRYQDSLLFQGHAARVPVAAKGAGETPLQSARRIGAEIEAEKPGSNREPPDEDDTADVTSRAMKPAERSNDPV